MLERTVLPMSRGGRAPSPGGVRSDRFLLALRDALVALGACAIAMAIMLGVISVTSSGVIGGGAGSVLAQLFAATLAIAGGFGLLLAALLSPEPVNALVAAIPLAIGGAAGLLEAALFLAVGHPLLLVAVPVAAGLAASLAHVWRPDHHRQRRATRRR